MIPKKIKIGGQEVTVKHVRDNAHSSNLASINLPAGVLIIHELWHGETVSESSRINSFYHELVHGILDTMGEHTLSSNEVFVSSFSSMLVESMQSFKYVKNKKSKKKT